MKGWHLLVFAVIIIGGLARVKQMAVERECGWRLALWPVGVPECWCANETHMAYAGFRCAGCGEVCASVMMREK